MKKQLWLYLFILTLLLQPWRNFFCQDDGAYAFSAINWSHGFFINHAANLSFLLPQISLGALALKIFSFVDSMRVLNFLTWICFCVLISFFSRMWLLAPRSKFLFLSFFSFPIWWQYGASYLVEIYSCLFVVSYLYCCDNFAGHFKSHDENTKYWTLRFWAMGVFVFSFLVGVQIQSLVTLPVLCALFFRRKGSRELAFLSLTGAATSLCVYYFFPHTVYQEGYGYWVVQNWRKLGVLKSLFHFSFQALQASFALGLFFTPFLRWTRINEFFSSKVVKLGHALAFFQILFVVVGTFSRLSVMGGGVLFFDYLPVWLGHSLLSFGIWGLVAAVELLSSSPREAMRRNVFYFSLAMIGFSAFRFANDIRVVMAPVAGIFYFLSTRKILALDENVTRIGSSKFYFGALFTLSLISNLYNLNTNQARWDAARQFDQKGISKNVISAGVGYNLFYLEDECVTNLVRHIHMLRASQQSAGLDKMQHYWQSQYYYDWIFVQVNRSYSMDWTPQIEIKPETFMGVSIGSAMKGIVFSRQILREEKVPYSVLGIPQSLRVVEYAQPRAGSCFDLIF